MSKHKRLFRMEEPKTQAGQHAYNRLARMFGGAKGAGQDRPERYRETASDPALNGVRPEDAEGRQVGVRAGPGSESAVGGIEQTQTDTPTPLEPKRRGRPLGSVKRKLEFRGTHWLSEHLQVPVGYIRRLVREGKIRTQKNPETGASLKCEIGDVAEALKRCPYDKKKESEYHSLQWMGEHFKVPITHLRRIVKEGKIRAQKDGANGAYSRYWIEEVAKALERYPYQKEYHQKDSHLKKQAWTAEWITEREARQVGVEPGLLRKWSKTEKLQYRILESHEAPFGLKGARAYNRQQFGQLRAEYMRTIRSDKRARALRQAYRNTGKTERLEFKELILPQLKTLLRGAFGVRGADGLEAVLRLKRPQRTERYPRPANEDWNGILAEVQDCLKLMQICKEREEELEPTRLLDFQRVGAEADGAPILERTLKDRNGETLTLRIWGRPQVLAIYQRGEFALRRELVLDRDGKYELERIDRHLSQNALDVQVFIEDIQYRLGRKKEQPEPSQE